MSREEKKRSVGTRDRMMENSVDEAAIRHKQQLLRRRLRSVVAATLSASEKEDDQPHHLVHLPDL